MKVLSTAAGELTRRERRGHQSLVRPLSELVIRTSQAHTPEAVLEAAGRGLLSLGLRFIAGKFQGEGILLEQVTEADARTERVEAVLHRPLKGLCFELPPEASLRKLDGAKSPVFVHGLAAPVAAGLSKALGQTLPDLRASLVSAGLNHAILTPVFMHGEAWGLFIVCGGSLRPEDVPAVTLFSAHVATALEAADVIQGLERQNRQLAALDAVSRASGDPEIPLLSERLAQIAAEATQSDLAAIARVDEHTHALSLLAAAGSSFRKLQQFRRLTLEGSLLSAETLRDPRPRSFLARSPSPMRGYLEAFGVQSLAVLPLVVKGRVGWLLYVARTEHRPYTAEELSQAEILAGQICVQLENAWLFQKAQEKVSQLSLLFAIARACGEEPALFPLVAKVLQELVVHIRLEAASLYTVEPARLRFVATRQRVDSGASPSSRVFDLPLDTSTLYGKAALEKTVCREGREVVVPLLLENRVVGVLGVETAPHAPFRDEEVQLLEACAAQLGVAVERRRISEAPRR